MKRNVKMVFVLVIMILALLPHRVFAVGEYDGHWVGTENVSVQGETETVRTDTIIFQQDADNLYFAEGYFGSIHLVRSGNDWIIPSPLSGELWGYDVDVNSMKLTFASQTDFTGSITASVDVDGEWVSGNATLSFSKQACSTLSNGVPVYNLSGGEDSFQCFEIELPETTTSLTVTTSGGSGDCDLGVAYHQPDFHVETSEGDYNDEEVNISSPQSGRWYVSLYGFESYSGLTLLASYEARIGNAPGSTSFDVRADEQLQLNLNPTTTIRRVMGQLSV